MTTIVNNMEDFISIKEAASQGGGANGTTFLALRGRALGFHPTSATSFTLRFELADGAVVFIKFSTTLANRFYQLLVNMIGFELIIANMGYKDPTHLNARDACTTIATTSTTPGDAGFLWPGCNVGPHENFAPLLLNSVGGGAAPLVAPAAVPAAAAPAAPATAPAPAAADPVAANLATLLNSLPPTTLAAVIQLIEHGLRGTGNAVKPASIMSDDEATDTD
jgi:hypothetical protein